MIELTKKYKSGSAAEILRNAILGGDIPEGTMITQNDIARSLGTSRMPVREALILLEFQGLIVRHSNQHVQVVTLTDEHIRSLFRDLASLEIESLKQMQAEKVDALLPLKEQMTFHRTLCSFTDSPLRRKVLEILTEVYLSFVLGRSDSLERIESVFQHVRLSVRHPVNAETLRQVYELYSSSLSGELIRLRRKDTTC